jgi:endonuclease G
MVDFGFRETRGTLTDQLAVRCHVQQKYRGGLALQVAMERGETSLNLAALPPINGFPVDVIQGRYRTAAWQAWNARRPVSGRRGRSDPLRAGISISGAYVAGSGTLGGLVYDRATGAPMLLSNWHVLIGDWLSRPRRAVYQPGRGDGGGSADAVAYVVRDGMQAGVDAAVAELNGNRELLNEQLGIGAVSGVQQPSLGQRVVKSGRTSEVTHGLVTAVEGIASIKYSGLTRLIYHVISIDPQPTLRQVSQPGDSGSFWLDESSQAAIGLHFAGSEDPERALAITMQVVLDTLAVNLLPARAAAAPPEWRAAPAQPRPAVALSDEPQLSPQLVAAINRAGLLAEHGFGPAAPNGNGHHSEEDQL